MTNANDNAYWDALPFQGWHCPDFIRIQDGKYKSPNSSGQVTILPEGLTQKQIEHREMVAQQKMVRAERMEKEKVERREFFARQKAETDRLKKERSDRMKAEAAARKPVKKEKHLWEGEPLPKPVKTVKEKKLATARRWREKNREKAIASTKASRDKKRAPGYGKTAPSTVIAHYPTGDVTYASLQEASKGIGRSAPTIREAANRGILVAGIDVTIIRDGVAISSKQKRESRPYVPTNIKVKIIARKGDEVMEFDSITAAADAIGRTRSAVRLALTRGNLVAEYEVERK